jgi:hypothetical protein
VQFGGVQLGITVFIATTDRNNKSVCKSMKNVYRLGINEGMKLAKLCKSELEKIVKNHGSEHIATRTTYDKVLEGPYLVLKDICVSIGLD